MSNLHALPTEALLDDSTAGLETWRQPPEVRRWLAELADEADTNARCGLIAHTLRKQIDTPVFTALGRAILSGSVRGDAEAIAALAGFLAVDGPGEGLIDRVHEFSNLHREADITRRAMKAGNPVAKNEQDLLARLNAVDNELAAQWKEPEPGASVRDRGPAWRCRRAFAALVAELRARGRLDDDAMLRFCRLARLELDALEFRAGNLAGAINPYSARQVSQVMPILSSVDEELRDMRRFVGRLEETKRSSLFHEQFPTLSSSLDDRDESRLRDRLGREEHLQLLWRLLRGLDRNSLPQRSVAWLVDRILDVGEVLVAAQLRRRGIDVVTALLVVFDHHRDGVVAVHASAAVREAIARAGVEGVTVTEDAVHVVLDGAAARRQNLPHGLPVPAREEAVLVEEGKEKEETVKDLVMANINNTSVLLGLLKNQKVVNTPGVVRLVVERVRNMRVLDTICTSRNLHAGFANRDVPLAILRSPMPIPIKTLRKFVNARYVSKVDLARLAKDKSAIRREVAEEVEAYLKSLA